MEGGQKANRGGEKMDRIEKQTKEGKIEEERDTVIDKREENICIPLRI